MTGILMPAGFEMISVDDMITDGTFSWSALSKRAMAALENVVLPTDFQIPSLPTALTRFMEAAEDIDVEIKVLGEIVAQDPGLTIDLLKCVNASARSVGTPARTPTEALVRLGIPTARTYLTSVAMKNATRGFDSKLMNHRNFWNESLQRALFAKKSAAAFGIDPQFAFMGGLLQDFILPVVTNQLDEAYISYLRGDAKDGRPLAEWEMETFGWTHAGLGAAIAKEWNLPDDLLCALFLHHDMEIALKAPNLDLFNLFPVTLAALLPDQLGQVPTGINRLLDADGRSAHFQLTKLCEEVDEELENLCEGVDRPVCLGPVVEAARESLHVQET